MTDSIYRIPSGQRSLDKSSASPQGPASETPSGEQKKIVFSALFENLERVRAFVGQEAEECCLDEAAQYAVQLAVDEAFSNIIEHAYGGESQEKIECTCQITEAGLVITLRDCGRPFNPASVPVPDLEAELEDRDIGGLGLYFIQQLMDEVDFTFTREPETGRHCNLLRMVKHKER
jgi:serine/threonine-protein kinase RsbW